MRDGGAAMSERATVMECDAVEPPYDPTAEMLEAGAQALDDNNERLSAAAIAGQVWRAMHRAAQPQPQPSEMRAKVDGLIAAWRIEADEMEVDGPISKAVRDALNECAADLERVLGEAGDA